MTVRTRYVKRESEPSAGVHSRQVGHRQLQSRQQCASFSPFMTSPKNEAKHVMSERNVLLGNVAHPFLVGLHYSFQTSSKLYFVLDYVNGGASGIVVQRTNILFYRIIREFRKSVRESFRLRSHRGWRYDTATASVYMSADSMFSLCITVS